MPVPPHPMPSAAPPRPDRGPVGAGREPGGSASADPRSHGGPAQATEAPSGSSRADRRPGGRAPVRIVIVDDHVLVREGTAQLLESEPDLQVVGQAGTAEEGLDLVDRLTPDVVLVDISLPGESGLELARQVVGSDRSTHVLVVSAYDDHAYVTEALDIGVGGYLLKTASAQELIDAVHIVATGAFVLDASVSSRLRRRREGDLGEPRGPGALTPREADVLELLAQGRSNKEIAAELALGLRTVETHVSRVLAKLGAASRTQAVAYALQHRLVGANGRGDHPPG